MITIALCMIVKNEEKTLERCLKSVKNIVDEFIIVDTGSSDETKNIAKKYTDNIYDFKWIDDFSAARNFAFSKASKDYILWLDADDTILPQDAEKFKNLKSNLDPSVDSVTMKYNISFDEYGNATMSYRRNRLVKREKYFKWIGFVHEYLEVYGNIFNSDISVTHKKINYSPKRNLEIFQNKLKEGVKFTPRDTLYYGNELYDHRMFKEALKYYNNFLDSKRGWYEDNINVCGKICDYYQSINNEELCRRYAFKSFEYAIPRAEICCRLGFSYLKENKINEATFWYETAANLKKPKESLGFFNDACWTWLPHLQLCVCYDKLGKHKLAFKHNELAATFRPNDKRILFNRNYFKKIGIN